MKKIVLILILFFVFIVAIVWYYQSNNVNQKVETKGGISKVSNESDVSDIKTEQSILLYPISGEVSFKSSPDAEFQKVTASPTIISNQAIVHTDIGKASVLLPDNSTISLENNTEITVNYSEKDTSIYQSMGSTYHRVQKLLSGSSYQVQTAGTLAAVRGTKFAVKYDTKTKKTKIAVTESKVQVSTIPKAINGVTPKEETVLVDTGKTVSIAMSEGEGKAEASPSAVTSKQNTIQLIDTVNDKDMNTFVNEQKKTDTELENIKKDYQDKEELRKEVKRVLFDDKSEKNTDNNKEKTEKIKINENDQNKLKEVIVEKRIETKKEKEVIKAEEKPKQIDTTREVVDEIKTAKKMDEESFFNAFEPLFIQHFYLDENDTPCKSNTSPEDRVKIVTTFANSNGYTITKSTLLSFAQEIQKYCSRKDASIKTKLQGRFDDEYPF